MSAYGLRRLGAHCNPRQQDRAAGVENGVGPLA